MKKIICYLLAAVICLSLLPVSALAVKEQAVKGVGIWDIKLPSVGEFPDTVATALGKGYSIDTDKTLYNSEVVGDYLINNIYYVMNGVGFYDRTGRQWLTFNDTFTYSRTYTAYVYLKADDGYYFDLDALEANIHGVDATIIPDEKQPTKKICVTADFYCDITDVELIMINDVEPPVAGMTPADYKISMAYPEYYTLKTSLIGYVNGIRWVDSAGKTLTAKSKFVEGEVYTVEFAVMSAQKNGKDVSSFSDKISAMINGKYVENGTWDEVYWASSSLVRVYYTLPAAVAAPEVEEDTVIKNVEIGDITAPEAFVAPVYHASVADSELYRVDLENTPYGAMNNGMLWYNSTDSLLFLPTSMVIPGNTYTAAVFLEAKEGYTFDTEALSVTINGRGGDYLFYGDNPRYVCVYADFDVPEKTVYEVEVEMTVPVAGEEVPFYAYTNNNAYYWDSYDGETPAVIWEDLTDGYEGTLSEGDTFKAGHEYVVSVCLRAGRGCSFALDEEGYSAVRGYMNGDWTSVIQSDLLSPEEYVFIIYYFTVEGELEAEVKRGDINGDGRVNSLDSNTITRIVTGSLPLTEEALLAGDLNGDGKLNSIDSNALKRLLTGRG